MDGLVISPKFLASLEEERKLSHPAFVAACGLTEERYKELTNGKTPSAVEIIRIVSGFQLTNGVPMVPRSQKLVARCASTFPTRHCLKVLGLDWPRSSE